MNIIRYTIPVRCMPKKRPRVVQKDGRRWSYMEPKYTAWIDKFRRQLLGLATNTTDIALQDASDKLNPTDQPLVLAVVSNASRRGTGDCDNLLGAPMDAGNNLLYVDDKQVHGAIVIRNDADTDYQATLASLGILLVELSNAGERDSDTTQILTGDIQ